VDKSLKAPARVEYKLLEEAVSGRYLVIEGGITSDWF